MTSALSALNVRDHVRPGLEVLLLAHDYARELGVDTWEFAVELPTLYSSGLTNSDVRWLLYRQLVKHAREIPGANGRREFRTRSTAVFGKRSCLVLTDEGAAFVRQLGGLAPVADRASGNGSVPGNGRPPQSQPQSVAHRSACLKQTPRWDAERHELWLGGTLVKQYKVPSPNQETILLAFQEEHWPYRIDDPLRPHPDLDPKRRLHDTIKSLNRSQKRRCLRFKGDGSGEGVCWDEVLNDL